MMRQKEIEEAIESRGNNSGLTDMIPITLPSTHLQTGMAASSYLASVSSDADADAETETGPHLPIAKFDLFSCFPNLNAD